MGFNVFLNNVLVLGVLLVVVSLVSTSGKVYRYRISCQTNPTYTKNLLISCLDDKNQSDKNQSSWSIHDRFKTHHIHTHTKTNKQT